jgi:hypothetical protein
MCLEQLRAEIVANIGGNGYAILENAVDDLSITELAIVQSRSRSVFLFDGVIALAS